MTMQKMLQIQAKIISNIQVAENYFKMCLDASAVAQKAEPGQFIYVKVNDKYDPLLRRAFSVHRISQQPSVNSHQLKNKKKINQIEILYKVKGIGTKILSEKEKGEELDILGPLGNGFNLSAIRYPLSAILVAGGIGVAPLVFLAKKIYTHTLNAKHQILVLIGAKTKQEILCIKDFRDLGCEVRIAIENGASGKKVLVTDLLKEYLSTVNPEGQSYGTGSQLSTVIFACGPTPMLKEIAKINQEYKIPCQVSLEEKMACGVGACLGCVVKIANRKDTQKFIYKRVCKDGPVFEAQEIIW